MPRRQTVALGVALIALVVGAVLAISRALPAATPAKPPAKTQTQSKTGAGNSSPDKLNSDSSQISVAEGSTASAIRGSTAASQASTSPAALGRAIVVRGLLSPDSENAKNDRDPPFAPAALAAVQDAASLAAAPGMVRMTEMPNAKDIAAKASNFLSQKEIKIALLGQHKYMINDCLGVKVSVGEFILKLANPTVSIVDQGIVTQFKIDKISMTAFSLRFRPDPSDLAQPCHFSGRLGLFGEANDVSITVTYNPLIDVQKCQIGNPATWVVRVGCGKVALQPLPPGIVDLTGPFNDMIVDAINYALNGSTQIAGATGNSIPIPMIGSMLGDAINKAIAENCPFKENNSGQSTASAASAATPVAAPPTTLQAKSETYVVTPIVDAKGRLGRLVLKMPDEAKETHYVVAKAGAGENRPVKSGYGALDATLLPGEYDVYLSKKLIAKVPVESGKQTALAIGEIKTTADKNTHVVIYDADGKKELFAGYGAHMIALPAGDYVLDISGANTPVTVKADNVAEY
jgi:hypothetical protein